MNIPEVLRLGGDEYRIEVHDRIGGSDDIFGCTLFDENRILLKDMSSAQVMEKTLLHEMVHAIHEHMGMLDNAVLDEEYVNGFASALYAIIRQNPNIFRTE